MFWTSETFDVIEMKMGIGLSYSMDIAHEATDHPEVRVDIEPTPLVGSVKTSLTFALNGRFNP